MARRLKTIARWVNENLGSYGYHATVKPHYYGYTVGKVGMLIGYSGERYGNLFECWELTDLEDKYDEPNTYRRRSLRQFSGMEGIWRRIYSHNTAEPYRNNAEVESFVRGLVKRIREENPDAEVANYEAEEFEAETETFEARYKNDGTIAYTETEWFGGYSRRGINSWGAIPLGNFERERYSGELE